MTEAAARPDIAAIVRTSARVLGLLLAACGTIGSILTILFFLQGAPGRGILDADFTRTIGPGQQHDRVTRVAPDSPLAAYGVHAGDDVAFDRAEDDGKLQRLFRAGEPIGMTVLAPRPHHIVVATMPQKDSSFTFLAILDNCTSLLSMTIGSLILLRSRRSNALVTLGLCFIAFAIYSTVLPQNQTPDAFFWYTTSWTVVQSFGVAVGFVLFGILFWRENNGPVPRAVWLAFWIYTLVFAMVTAGVTSLTMLNYALPLMVNAIAYGLALTEAGFIAAFVALVIGWRRSRRELQNRYAIMCVAISMVIACDVMFSFQNLLFGGFGSPQYRALYITAEWLSAAGHLLFAYAVLRDRVLDLGFVVNRAVVYGVISAILLVVFGLVEWGAEKVIPERWLAGQWKDVLDALIALGVYLVFHRVRDTVERFIENLFFHKWHANEEALRRFVREADFISQPDALVAAFTAELRRFTGQTGQVVYIRDEDGRFVAVSGRGGAVDYDDPALVAMRARHAAVEPERLASKLHAALALPMSHRGEVFGFVLVPAKPDGNGYRPDETEALQWATHQIGLDYHALEVESVRRDAAALREQNAALNAVIERALIARAAT